MERTPRPRDVGVINEEKDHEYQEKVADEEEHISIDPRREMDVVVDGNSRVVSLFERFRLHTLE